MTVDRKRIGKNNKQRGAQEERNVLELLKAYFGEEFHRVGNRGASSADVESDTRIAEVKSRQTPTFRLILDAWSQIELAHEQTGKEAWLVLSFIDNGKRVRWLVKRLT